MPLVTARPIGQSNGDVVTEFVDVADTGVTTWTYSSTQNRLHFVNRGNQDITVIVGSNSYTVNQGTSRLITDVFTSFTTQSASKTQEFNARAIKVTAIPLENITAQLAENSEQLEQKATKPEVDVERKRIDNFTTLPQGSTTGDAELMDIRVGQDGVTYTNAGQSIRGQFEKSLKGVKNVSGVGDPYIDFNNVPNNVIVRYSINAFLNGPTVTVAGGTLVTIAYNGVTASGGRIQTFYGSSGTVHTRMYWGGQWSEWNDNKDFAKGRIGSLDKFSDFDNIPPNSIYVITVGTLANSPAPGLLGNLVTLNDSGGIANVNGTTQMFTTNAGSVYSRIRWSNNWSGWKRLDSGVVNEDSIYTLAMFENLGVVGDSYASGASGENPGDTVAIDHYSVSWPQILGRKNGIAVTNYTKGGLSTRSWITDTKGLPALKNDTPKQVYILALVRNDYNIENGGENGYIGNEADMVSKIDTFYGNYARIIEEIKAHAPNAKLILMTGDYTASNVLGTTYNEAIKKIATYFGLPCMVQIEHPYFSSSNYVSNRPNGGHPGISQYSGMSKAIESMFSKAIENNVEYFKYFKS